MPEREPIGLGALAQPSGQGGVGDLPRAPRSSEEYQANRQRAGTFLERLAADPDAIRFLGTMGGWMLSGQGLGPSVMAAGNQLADSQQLRAAEAGRRQEHDLQGRRVDLEARRTATGEQQAAAQGRYQQGVLQGDRDQLAETTRSNKAQEEIAMATQRRLLAAAVNKPTVDAVKGLYENAIEAIGPMPLGAEEQAAWGSALHQFLLRNAPTWGVVLRQPEGGGAPVPTPGAGGPAPGPTLRPRAPTTEAPPRSIEDILGEAPAPATRESPFPLSRGREAPPPSPARTDSPKATEIQQKVQAAEKALGRAFEARSNRNPRSVQRAFDNLIQVYAQGAESLSGATRQRIERELKKLQALGATRSGGG